MCMLFNCDLEQFRAGLIAKHNKACNLSCSRHLYVMLITKTFINCYTCSNLNHSKTIYANKECYVTSFMTILVTTEFSSELIDLSSGRTL